MTQNYQTIKTSKKLTDKLSIASGLLCFLAVVVAGLGETWGFPEVAIQIADTCYKISGAITVYFLGSTSRKLSKGE